jgi:hypothetical protein
MVGEERYFKIGGIYCLGVGLLVIEEHNMSTNPNVVA